MSWSLSEVQITALFQMDVAHAFVSFGCRIVRESRMSQRVHRSLWKRKSARRNERGARRHRRDRGFHPVLTQKGVPLSPFLSVLDKGVGQPGGELKRKGGPAPREVARIASRKSAPSNSLRSAMKYRSKKSFMRLFARARTVRASNFSATAV